MSDYSSLMIRIDQVPQGEDLLAAFPRLSRYEEFSYPMEHRDKVIRYVVLCYDMGSPLQNVDSLAQKKAMAAHQAGFLYQDESFEAPVIAMMDGKILPVNKMIIRYCRMQHSRLYSLIVSGNEAFHEASEKLLVASTDSDDVLKDMKTKMEIFDKAKANAISLDNMSRELLSGDNSALIQKTLYTIVDNNDSVIPLTPEDFAL